MAKDKTKLSDLDLDLNAIFTPSVVREPCRTPSRETLESFKMGDRNRRQVCGSQARKIFREEVFLNNDSIHRKEFS